MNRKIVISIFVVVLLIAGAAFYYSSTQPSQKEEESSGPLQITKVLDEPVISPVSSYDNNSIWYFNSNARLFKVNADGSNLSEFPLPSFTNGKLISVLWPKDGSDFIAITNEPGELSGSAQVKQYYDSTTKLFINLAKNINWIEWLPDGKKVVYIWQSDDKKTQQLVTANADGSGFKNVASVFWPDLALKVDPTGSTVLMYRTQIQGDTNKIYAANLNTGVISTIVDNGKNLSAKWLPTGNKFLYSQQSKIFLFDVLNRMAVDLKLDTNLDKVVADNTGKTLYAAVKGPAGGDKFVKVNLNNGLSETYFEASSDVYVKSIMLVGNTVYYVDSRDNKFYRISK